MALTLNTRIQRLEGRAATLLETYRERPPQNDTAIVRLGQDATAIPRDSLSDDQRARIDTILGQLAQLQQLIGDRSAAAAAHPPRRGFNQRDYQVPAVVVRPQEAPLARLAPSLQDPGTMQAVLRFLGAAAAAAPAEGQPAGPALPQSFGAAPPAAAAQPEAQAAPLPAEAAPPAEPREPNLWQQIASVAARAFRAMIQFLRPYYNRAVDFFSSCLSPSQAPAPSPAVVAVAEANQNIPVA